MAYKLPVKYILLSEVARILGLSYQKFYQMTFEPDFPTKHGENFLRNDLYMWMIRRGFKTTHDIDVLRANDEIAARHYREKLKASNRDAQARSRAKRRGA